MPVTIDFNDGFRPDLGDNLGGHLRRASNVVPAEDGYEGFREFVGATDPLPGVRPLGAISIRDQTATAQFFAANENDIFQLTGDTWTNVSTSPLAYNTGSNEVWDMVSYGIGTVASNFTDPIQTKIEGTDALFRPLVDIGDDDNYLDGAAGGNADRNDVDFVDPHARWTAEVADHLLLGYTTDNVDGLQPDRLWWSRLNDPTKFIPDADFLSNFVTLRGGGSIQRVVSSGEYGVVFKERSIYRADPGNPVEGFDVNEVDQARGALVPGGVIPFGRVVGFIAEDGFYLFDGRSSTPIGVGKVDRTFRRLFDPTNARFVRGAVDAENKTFMWVLPLGNATGDPNRVFVYNWQYDNWSELEVPIFQPVNAEIGGAFTDSPRFAGVTVDSLIDTFVDSPEFRADSIQFGAFNSLGELAFNTGRFLPVTFETSDTEFVPGQRVLVNSSRPRFQGSDDQIFVSFGGRNRPNDPHVFTPEAGLNLNGECPARINARYTRFRVTAPTGHGITRFHSLDFEDQMIQQMGLR